MHGADGIGHKREKENTNWIHLPLPHSDKGRVVTSVRDLFLVFAAIVAWFLHAVFYPFAASCGENGGEMFSRLCNPPS